MDARPVWLILLSYALLTGYAEAIQCYTCENCKSLKETPLQECQADAMSDEYALMSTTTDVSTTTEDWGMDSEEDALDEDDKALLNEQPERTHITNRCYKVMKKLDNGLIQTSRGCVAGDDNDVICKKLNPPYGLANIKWCVLCSEDKCNSASAWSYSFAAALLVIANLAFLQ